MFNISELLFSTGPGAGAHAAEGAHSGRRPAGQRSTQQPRVRRRQGVFAVVTDSSSFFFMLNHLLQKCDPDRVLQGAPGPGCRGGGLCSAEVGCSSHSAARFRGELPASSMWGEVFITKTEGLDYYFSNTKRKEKSVLAVPDYHLLWTRRCLLVWCGLLQGLIRLVCFLIFSFDIPLCVSLFLSPLWRWQTHLWRPLMEQQDACSAQKPWKRSKPPSAACSCWGSHLHSCRVRWRARVKQGGRGLLALLKPPKGLFLSIHLHLADFRQISLWLRVRDR